MRQGWAQTGTLTPGSSNTVNMQQAFEDTGAYTVQFSVNGRDESGSAGTRIPKAVISWTVNGNTIHRKIDVVNGTTISGIADSVNVSVSDNSISPAALSPYDVTIMVAPGTRASVQQPPYLTGPVVALPAGAGAASQQIPQDAGITSVFVTVAPQVADGAVPEFDALVQQASGGGILKSYDPRQAEWVPLAAGTTNIVLRTGAAAPATVWSITFGIDG